ncbi:hypothetical protein I204_08284 [Kwoniella mangroviensis CBS 8886]|uniref:hypothetical protein n=1 Tax=Kwoniella mangroviensis CBS 8507 TaxID=1296122 RepID=UPI00080D113D|nr:uncharacterized protein I203_08350 [Kwoniella mangroviensis CBS 8507]OCF62549.1 hypothetical protein I203_08350 [Kwoniella mangroviensis CBS 8507]OCF71048.1 hypothetical protein I204_08284 [Kwoniella mangroviensis CBS 8886]
MATTQNPEPIPLSSPSPAPTLSNSTHNVLTSDTTLSTLSAVHPLLLDILRILIPTVLLRVSKTFYDDLVPGLYHTLYLNEGNIRGILEGYDDGSGRKKDALALVRELTICDLQVLEYLSELDPDIQNDIRIDRSQQTQIQTLNGPIQSQLSSENDKRIDNHPDDGILCLFPNLETIHLPFKFITSLNQLTILSNEISHDDDHLHRTRRVKAERKLNLYPLIFSRYFNARLITLDLGQEIDTDLYWAFDSTLFNLLDSIPQSRSMNTKLRIETVSPRERPSRGYIPHNLLQASTIHFVPIRKTTGAVVDPAANSGEAFVGTGLVEIGKNEDLAKVIRDHYDVHTSRPSYPPILYHVRDVRGVIGEMEKMMELRVRVEQELLVDEDEGGLLREEK